MTKMTKAELKSKINFVRKRHNKRQIFVVIAALIVFTGGAKAADYLELTPGGRYVYVFSLIAALILVGLVGTLKNLKADRKDCIDNSILCLHCGKQLYDWTKSNSPEKTGKCCHCNELLIENIKV
jgi:hypothetical protein